jgi:hypothetical protein
VSARITVLDKRVSALESRVGWRFGNPQK